MPDGAPSHIVAEQLNARAEDHINMGELRKDLHKLWNGIERRSKIRIPEPNEIEAAAQCKFHPLPDCFGLALIYFQNKYLDVIFSAVPKRFDQLSRAISASIVNEDKMGGGTQQEIFKVG
jgi:hypothetical protein